MSLRSRGHAPSIRLLPMSGSWMTKCLLACIPIMSSTAVPVYFEESWAILSSLGLVNVLFGLMIIGITSLSPVSIVVSVAGAIANGLCYVQNLFLCSILRAHYCREHVACARPFYPKKHLLSRSSMPSTQTTQRLVPWLQRQLQT